MVNELFGKLSGLIDYTPPKRVVNRMMQEQSQALAKNIVDSGGSKEDVEKALEESREPLHGQATDFLKRKALGAMLTKTLKSSVNEIDLQEHSGKLAALQGKRPEVLRQELIDSDNLSSVSAQVFEVKNFNQLADQLIITDIDARDLE